MNNFLSQLNLTPQERRIVVIIFLVVIVVLNLLFVWPHFGEWGSINRQLDDMRKTMANYNHIIEQDVNPTNGYRKLVNKLSRLEGGGSMDHPVDPQNQLNATIRAQEKKTGVYVSNFGVPSVKTNEFFEEISTSIDVESQEPQLVNFLYNMGMDPAMIRVAKLDLKPADANRYKLKGSITLTANYTKKPPTAVSAAPAAKPETAPGNKPAAAPAKKTAPPPVPAQPATRLPGPPAPGPNRQPSGGAKPFFPNRPIPRPGPGQPGPPPH
jgi:Tfp pilus assembly protein PilO